MKPLQLLIYLLYATCFPFTAYAQDRRFYISLYGSDNAAGSIKEPFATIERAQQAVKETRLKTPRTNIQVFLRAGTYILENPLHFGPEDGGDSTISVKYSSYPGENVTISGGKILKGEWRKITSIKENIWKISIPEAKNGNWIFRSLFTGSGRLQRARSDTFLTKKTLPKFINSFKIYDFKTAQSIIKDSIEGFCGFTYNNKDLDRLKFNSGTEVNLYHSWDTSWHTICHIDTLNKTILFKNPSTYPVGFFSNHLRYIVENSIQFLNKPGRWYLDIDKGELYYYANLGENPNKMVFIIPKLQELVLLKGTTSAPVNNISFYRINFSYTSIPSGIHEVSSATKIPNADNFPCLDLSEGFSSLQAALGAGQSILLQYAKSCSFVNCNFTHLGNYAIRIGEYSNRNILLRCTINDCSGGGVVIGFDNRFISINSYKKNDKIYVIFDRRYAGNKKLPFEIAPSYNSVKECSINNCGLYFTSSVGIGLMQAHHNRIVNNTVYNLPYSGISVGWDYDFSDNFTSYNRIENNTIHDVMKLLADGGAIYTLGKQIGTVYKGNRIYNVFRSRYAVGSRNNGFFFDEGSSNFTVENNNVKSIANEDYRFNKTDSSRIILKNNRFERSHTKN